MTFGHSVLVGSPDVRI